MSTEIQAILSPRLFLQLYFGMAVQEYTSILVPQEAQPCAELRIWKHRVKRFSIRWRDRNSTVKVGNFDHLVTFKIVLKLFPNSFLTIFLYENVRVLWYFWDLNLNTRFGSQKYHIFLKMLGGRSHP